MPPTIFPTGVTIYRPDKAHNCFVVFDGRDQKTYLIDMNGNDVHTWNYSGFPSEMIDPRFAGGEYGHIFAQKEAEMFANETLLELDWDGDIVWEWGKKAPGGKAWQNHDQARLPNGNTLVLSKLVHVVPALSDQPINDQPIYEVTPDGDVVWQWNSAEHLDELGFSKEVQRMMLSKTSRPRSTLLVINDMHPLGPNKWHKAGDERFHPDNVIIDSREGNFVAIIAKKTGKVVWRLGPDDFSQAAFTGKIPRPVDMICGQHDAYMIPEGLPGTGNILIFDNNGSAGFPPFYQDNHPGSRIIEIDPITKQIVWQYDASSSNKNYWAFYSSFISSSRRLPNGNTLICEGMHGRLFQVTPEGEIVWEYLNPHFGEWADHHTSLGKGPTNWVFRAQPVPYDWVPAGTPHSENPVIPPKITEFRIG
jgi:hypothetical protein